MDACGILQQKWQGKSPNFFNRIRPVVGKAPLNGIDKPRMTYLIASHEQYWKTIPKRNVRHSGQKDGEYPYSLTNGRYKSTSERRFW